MDDLQTIIKNLLQDWMDNSGEEFVNNLGNINEYIKNKLNELPSVNGLGNISSIGCVFNPIKGTLSIHYTLEYHPDIDYLGITRDVSG